MSLSLSTKVVVDPLAVSLALVWAGDAARINRGAHRSRSTIDRGSRK